MYLVEQPKFTEKKMAEAEAKAAEALELMKSQVIDWMISHIFLPEREREFPNGLETVFNYFGG